MEDGRVIADSGPQVISRSKTDEHREEDADEGKKKPPMLTHEGGEVPRSILPPVLPSGHIRVPGSEVVLDEVTSTKARTTSTRVENVQYHDESLRELTGFEVHKKAITSPGELLSINDRLREDDAEGYFDGGDGEGKDGAGGSSLVPVMRRTPPGQLVHYSVDGKTVRDVTEESRVTRVDQVTGRNETEVTRTTHQEVMNEDEHPIHEGDESESLLPPEQFLTSTRQTSYYCDGDEEGDEVSSSDDDEKNGIVGTTSPSKYSRSEMERKTLATVLRVHEGRRGDSPDPGDYHFTRPLSSFRGMNGSSSPSSPFIFRPTSTSPYSSSSPFPRPLRIRNRSPGSRSSSIDEGHVIRVRVSSPVHSPPPPTTTTTTTSYHHRRSPSPTITRIGDIDNDDQIGRVIHESIVEQELQQPAGGLRRTSSKETFTSKKTKGKKGKRLIPSPIRGRDEEEMMDTIPSPDYEDDTNQPNNTNNNDENSVRKQKKKGRKGFFFFGM